MGKSFQGLLDKAKSMRLKGDDTQTMRTKLSSQGWDMNTIDKALWQLGFRDKKNIYFIQKMKKVGIGLAVVFGFAAIIAGTLYFENRRMENAEVAGTSDENAAAESIVAPQESEDISGAEEIVIGGEPVSSPEARVSFSYPDDWVLTTFSEDQFDDVYQWQLEHEDNEKIKETLKIKYEVTDAGEASVANFALLNDPLAQELTTVNILVNKAPSYEIEPSLEKFREDLEAANGQLGYTASDFRKIAIDGIEGYEYKSTIELGVIAVRTLEYVFLWEDQRLSVSVLPVDSAEHADSINAILESLRLSEF